MALRMRAKAIGIDKIDASQGRLSISFKDKTAIPPRVFTLLARKNKAAYLTRETYIWPYTGNCLPVIETLFQAFEDALAEIDAVRASLGN